MLMGDPLDLEFTTTAIQYKDSILIPYFMYRSNLSTSTSEFGYFETCYWFYYPKKIIRVIILFLVVEWYKGPIMFFSVIPLN